MSDLNKLNNHGYKYEVLVRPAYRGSNEQHVQVITVERDELVGIALGTEHLDHYKKIMEIQCQIPHMAKIQEVIDGFVIMEKASGDLMWEIEGDFTHLETCLMDFVKALKANGLVHADLRPWNVLYDRQLERYQIIDWGFSFFRGMPKPNDRTTRHLNACNHSDSAEEKIDEVDVKKMLALMNGTLGLQDAWNYSKNQFSWRPNWCQE